MDPCGTLHVTGRDEEDAPFKDMLWCRLDKYEENHLLAIPLP